MTLPRYPAYKDSGLEWLGEVPRHWSVTRLRFVVELNPSKSEISALDRDTEISFLPMEAIGDDGNLDLARTRPLGQVESGYTYFREGDVTVAKITPCFENGKGAVMRGLKHGIGFGTTELIVARPRSAETVDSYVHWVFVSRPFRMLGESYMYGAGGQKRVPDDFVRNFAIGLPPLGEQNIIASFLDHETSKIDALIAEQKNLIALLKEKRQAVISHAVTKGLDPDVPMKDSGVEWLREVPEHWSSGPLKYLARLVTGMTPPTADYDNYAEDGFPWVRPEDISEGGEPVMASKFLSDKGRSMARHVAPCSVLICCIGTIGKTGMVYQSVSTNQQITAAESRSNPRYLYFVTVAARIELETMATGNVLRILNTERLGAIKYPIPPLGEQATIATFLDHETAKIDALIGEAEHATELLQERRSALISAAVTGKIDVRGLVSQEAA